MPPASTHVQDSAPVIVDRVHARLRDSRRRRVWRHLALFACSVPIMLLLVVATRDSQARRAAESEARSFAAALQAEFDRTNRPVARPPEAASAALDRYYFNAFHPEMLPTHNPVGVLAPLEPLRLLLGGSGRFLILFDGQSYEARWFKEADFRDQAARLGLSRSQ